MGPGISEAQADAAALEAAKAFRAELVEKGILSEPKPLDPNFTSEVPGVQWHKRIQKWQVEINLKSDQKKIYGGYFTEKAVAEAKALELRGEGRPAAPGEARGHSVGAAGVPPQGAVRRGDLEPG